MVDDLLRSLFTKAELDADYRTPKRGINLGSRAEHERQLLRRLAATQFDAATAVVRRRPVGQRRIRSA